MITVLVTSVINIVAFSMTDEWMRGFNVTFALVRPKKQAGTMVLRGMAFMARMKLPFNLTVPEIKHWSRD